MFLFFFNPLLWAANSSSFFQFSTINALLEGVYEGELTIQELLQKGQIGLGTFDALDGEMVIIDGRCFRVNSQGMVEEVTADETTPFAAIAQEPSSNSRYLFLIDSYEELELELNKMIENSNLIYIIHIEADFQTLKARSVHRQTKPYPPLTEVTPNQAVFEFTEMSGDLVGFWCPQYFEGICVPGYHFHFIDKDLKHGGHLLDCSFLLGSVRVSPCYDVFMQLPRNQEFARANLAGKRIDEIQQVEK
jgi:acetolactate decarboxylase